LVGVWGEPKFFTVLDFFSASYFTVPVLLGLNLFFIVVSLMNFRKIRELRILLLYALIAFLQHLLYIYVNVFEDQRAESAGGGSFLNLFMLIELVLFYRFIGASLRSGTAKAFLKILMPAFVLVTLGSWQFSGSFPDAVARLSVIESYLIILPVLFYYYELLHHPPLQNIMSDPRFWSLTGMLFLFILIMPLFFQNGIPLVADKPVRRLHTLNCIGYIILFLFFINALRCQLRAPNT